MSETLINIALICFIASIVVPVALCALIMVGALVGALLDS